MWRTPADKLPGFTFNYDNMYQVVHDWGYNTIRIPVSWNNLEPVAPVWNATTGQYVHTWSTAYLNDLRSMVTKAQAAGLSVVLDLHQDFWSPALHHIVKWNGQQGLLRGRRDAALARPQHRREGQRHPAGVDFYNAMNRFYRNVPDPASTTTHATPWQLSPSAWSELSYCLLRPLGVPAYRAVVGADLLNEPYAKYVGGSPPAGQTVLQAAAPAQRLLHGRAPAVTGRQPGLAALLRGLDRWLQRRHPVRTRDPRPDRTPGGDVNWVYSMHDYDFGYGTFSDGVTRHDDFGITLDERRLSPTPGLAGAALRR